MNAQKNCSHTQMKITSVWIKGDVGLFQRDSNSTIQKLSYFYSKLKYGLIMKI